MTWTEADAKSAIITVGGTVLGGVLLVLIVGLALALARWGNKHETLAGWLIVAVSGAGAIIFRLAYTRGILRPANSRRSTNFKRAALAAMAIALMINFLALVGMAAGIH